MLNPILGFPLYRGLLSRATFKGSNKFDYLQGFCHVRPFLSANCPFVLDDMSQGNWGAVQNCSLAEGDYTSLHNPRRKQMRAAPAPKHRSFHFRNAESVSMLT